MPNPTFTVLAETPTAVKVYHREAPTAMEAQGQVEAECGGGDPPVACEVIKVIEGHKSVEQVD